MAGTKPLRRRPSADEAVKELQTHAEQFDSIPILNGQAVTVTVPTAAQGAHFAHSLGRPYQGILIVGLSSTAAPFSEFYPTEASAASAAGLDTRLFGQIACNLVTTAPHTVKVWIY